MLISLLAKNSRRGKLVVLSKFKEQWSIEFGSACHWSKVKENKKGRESVSKQIELK
jgi:hypothetical protein